MDNSKKVIKTLEKVLKNNPGAKTGIAQIIRQVELARQRGSANTEYARILTENLMMLGMTGAISRDDFLALNELGRECAFE